MNKRSKLKSYFYLLLCTALLVSSCKSRKAGTVSMDPNRPMEDRSVQELMQKLDENSFKAEWMSAKAAVTTIQDGRETSFNINMRTKKDSVIWISITPLLGIEVARVLITPDSVKLIDRLHSKYQLGSFESINKLLDLKVNFEIVQNLLVGNFFAYKKNENRFNSVYLEEKYYILSSLNKKKLKRALEEKDLNKPVIQDVYVSDSLYRITRLQVEDQKINKTLITEYNDFRHTNGGLFPYTLNTRILAEKNFEIKIEYEKISTGEVQEFPFNIPSGYERSR